MGKARIYKISDNQGRTAARNDNNKIREFEQQAGPVHSVAWSADGKRVCLGSLKEARVYAEDGKKIATLSTAHPLNGATLKHLWDEVKEYWKDKDMAQITSRFVN